jgi:hypothetical protein
VMDGAAIISKTITWHSAILAFWISSGVISSSLHLGVVADGNSECVVPRERYLEKRASSPYHLQAGTGLLVRGIRAAVCFKFLRIVPCYRGAISKFSE